MIGRGKGLNLIRVEDTRGSILLLKEDVRTLEGEKLWELRFTGWQGSRAATDQQLLIFRLEVERKKERLGIAPIVHVVTAALTLQVLQILSE